MDLVWLMRLFRFFPKFYIKRLVEEWNDFYKKTFAGFAFSSLSPQVVPPRKPRLFNWLVLIPYGIGMVEICEVLKRKNWVDEEIDFRSLVSDRYSFNCGSYGVWTPATFEAYDCFPSGRRVRKRFSIGIMTLEERLILELFWYRKEGKHLDSLRGTICSGSMDISNKTIPIVCWESRSKKLRITFIRPQNFPQWVYPRPVVPGVVVI